MKLKFGFAALLMAALLGGCSKQQQDAALSQGQAALSKAEGLAGGAWKSAVNQAQKLSADSGRPALQAAEKQLEAARDKLSGIKAPAIADKLKLDSVKAEIDRLESAMSVQRMKAALDQRVKIAMGLKENAQKSYETVKEGLERADAEFRDLQSKLKSAQDSYDQASKKVQETRAQIDRL